jgi:hypothetical protein
MKRLVILTLAAAALIVPSTALASGVVLKVQKATHLVAITRAKNDVALVHTTAASRLHVGQRIAITKTGVRVLGRARTATFRGLMLARSRSTMTVSAGGAVVTLDRDAHDRRPAPAPGATIGQTGELDEHDFVVDAAHPGGRIEGTLTLGTSTVTIVSEHIALVLNVPAGLDLAAFRSGDEVLAEFTQGADGTLTLAKLAFEDTDNDDNDNDGHDGRGGGHGDGDHSGPGRDGNG